MRKISLIHAQTLKSKFKAFKTTFFDGFFFIFHCFCRRILNIWFLKENSEKNWLKK